MLVFLPARTQCAWYKFACAAPKSGTGVVLHVMVDDDCLIAMRCVVVAKVGGIFAKSRAGEFPVVWNIGGRRWIPSQVGRFVDGVFNRG